MLKFIVYLRVFNKMRWENVEDHRPEFSPLVRKVSFFFFHSVPFLVDSGHLRWGPIFFFSSLTLSIFNSPLTGTDVIAGRIYPYVPRLCCVRECEYVCVCLCEFLSWSISFTSNLTGRHTFTVAVFFFFRFISYRFFNSSHASICFNCKDILICHSIRFIQTQLNYCSAVASPTTETMLNIVKIDFSPISVERISIIHQFSFLPIFSFQLVIRGLI